jgi:quinol monooxygenase YgiN
MQNRYFTVMITGMAKPGIEGHVKSFLTKLMEHTKKEAGCILYNIYQSTENPQEFLLFTVWKDAESFERHNQTPEMQEYKHYLTSEFFIKQSKKTYWTLLGE